MQNHRFPGVPVRLSDPQPADRHRHVGHQGEATAVVRVALSAGHTVASAITADAADNLGLEPGREVTVLVKWTEVTLAGD